MKLSKIINSGLSDLNFLNKITILSDNKIEATISIPNGTKMELIEAMAQTASLHLKKRVSFELHTFLAGVDKVKFSQFVNKKNYLLTMKVQSQSKNSSKYYGEIKSGEFCIISGIFLLSTTKYDNRFKRELLTNYYKEKINRLCNA